MKVTISKIEKLFSGLKKGLRSKVFALSPISNQFYLGKTFNEHECFIIKIPDRFSQRPECEKKVGKIVLSFYKDAKIKVRNITQKACIFVIELCEPSLCKTFYGLIQAFVAKSNQKSENWVRPDHIENYIQEWALLFSSDKELSELEKIGLWGELFFISQNKNPDKTIEKWHGPEQKSHDFVTGNESLDIKTGVRSFEHHFRKNQIETNGKVAFICQRIRASQKGKDLQRIVQEITKKLKNRELFQSKLAFLGYFKTQKDNLKYVLEAVRWVDSKHIPQPRKIDIGVTNYEFKSEVSAAKTLSKTYIQKIQKRLNY